MRGVQRIAFVALTIAVMLGCVVSALISFPEHQLLAMILPGVTITIIGLKISFALDRRALDRRMAPVLEVIKKAGSMGAKEKDYQRVLVEQFFVDLTPGLKPESPLPSGTTVDTWLSFDGDDWYITVKRGLSNQQRLVLQGEIEDILRHSPKRGKDLWILVLVGISESALPALLGQFNLLVEYTARRAVEVRPKAKRDVHIEVVPVKVVDGATTAADA